MLDISTIDTGQLDAIPEPTSWQAPHIAQTITEQIFTGTLILNNTCKIIYADTAAELLLGSSTGKLLHKDARILLAPEPFEALDVSAGHVHRYTTHLHSYRTTKTLASITLNSSLIGNRKLIFVSIAVINDTVEMQESLQMNQRLASLGMLTASIAHELKNPINVITNTCDNLNLAIAEEAPQSLSLSRYVSMIQKNAWHCARLVETLRSYMHKNQHGNTCDLNQLLKDAVSLVKPQFQRQRNVQLNIDLGEDVGDLMCVPSQITQVLINLLTNACDAVAKKEGMVWVKTWDVPELNSVAVSIRDNGHGIPQDLMEEIFEPFFTTKRQTDGTGMGLFIAAEIVKRHNGWIRVQNQLDENTEVNGVQFTIMLPRK